MTQTLVVVMAVALASTACAAQIATVPPAARTRALDVTGASSGKARLYVYRQGRGRRSLLPVAIDGVTLGSAARDSFLMTEFSPGAHIIASSTSENVSTVRLDVKEGESYFVRLSTRIGMKVTRTRLQQADPSEARAALGRLRMVDNFAVSSGRRHHDREPRAAG